MATRFIARQPILDRQRGVFAYELLFRNGTDGTGQVDPNLMASSTVDSALLFGVDNLTGRIRNVLATLSAYDEANLELVPVLSGSLKVDESKLPDGYAAAVRWADKALQS